MVPHDRDRIQTLTANQLVAICEEQAREIERLRSHITTTTSSPSLPPASTLTSSFTFSGRGVSEPQNNSYRRTDSSSSHSPLLTNSPQSSYSDAKTDSELNELNARLEHENAKYATKLKCLENELKNVQNKLIRAQSKNLQQKSLEKRHEELLGLFMKLQQQMNEQWRVKWNDQSLRQSIPSPSSTTSTNINNNNNNNNNSQDTSQIISHNFSYSASLASSPSAALLAQSPSSNSFPWNNMNE